MPGPANHKLRKMGFEPFTVTVVLEYSDRIMQYYCIFCRHGLFRTQRRVTQINYGNSFEDSEAIPFSLQCPQCGNVFHLVGFNM